MKLKASKRFKKLLEVSKNKKNETIEEAIKMVKKNCTTKFDESIDVSFNLNLKQKKEEVSLRTLVNLPNGNAKKIKLTGRKWEQKVYYRHSGYPGGIKVVKVEDYRANRSDRIVEYAVKGMLPKNRLGRSMAKKMKVYQGGSHPHESQKPESSQVLL